MNYKDDIVKLRDTINVPTKENGSPIVELDPVIFRVAYLKKDMIPLMGEKMYVRREVAERLNRIQLLLDHAGEGLALSIAYAYRAPIIQERYYANQLSTVQRNNPDIPGSDQVELTHSMVAHPSTAGHTTGGAVDLTLWNCNTDTPIDMGSGIAEFGDIAYTKYPDISPTQRANRLQLQRLMVDENFAPFLAEWWHFSYGDKEWAFYYHRPNAIFNPISLEEVRKYIVT